MKAKGFFIFAILLLLLSIFPVSAKDNIENIDNIFQEYKQEELEVPNSNKEDYSLNILDKMNYLLIIIFLGATGAVLIAGGEVYREIYDDNLEYKELETEDNLDQLEVKLKVLQYKLSFIESTNKYVPEEALFENLETLESLLHKKEKISSLLERFGG